MGGGPLEHPTRFPSDKEREIGTRKVEGVQGLLRAACLKGANREAAVGGGGATFALVALVYCYKFSVILPFS